MQDVADDPPDRVEGQQQRRDFADVNQLWGHGDGFDAE
jgi:hypothetical protein